MAYTFTSTDPKQIEEGIRHKYSGVIETAQGNFRYPTGRAGLEAPQYDLELINRLPEEAVASYCGVGNPFSLGPIREGEAVLDIGCGVGSISCWLLCWWVQQEKRLASISMNFIDHGSPVTSDLRFPKRRSKSSGMRLHGNQRRLLDLQR